MLVKKNLIEPLKKFSLVIILIFIIFGSFYIRSLVHYGTPDCYFDFTDLSGCNQYYETDSEYKYEGRTEETGTEVTIFRMGISNYLEFAYGYLWFVPFGIIAGLLLVIYRKSEVNTLMILVILASIPIFYIQ